MNSFVYKLLLIAVFVNIWMQFIRQFGDNASVIEAVQIAIEQYGVTCIVNSDQVNSLVAIIQARKNYDAP